MSFYRLAEHQPQLIGEGHFIAPSADLIGQVVLHPNSSVWFNAVIRADNDLIEVGAGSNIQDGSILHTDPGFPLKIAANVVVGHKVMLHGCTIGEGSLIGMNAVVLNGAVIGKNCLVGANALVTEGMQIPDGALVLGSPAKIKRIMSAEEQQNISRSAANYVRNSKRYNQQLERIDLYVR